MVKIKVVILLCYRCNEQCFPTHHLDLMNILYFFRFSKSYPQHAFKTPIFDFLHHLRIKNRPLFQPAFDMTVVTTFGFKKQNWSFGYFSYSCGSKCRR